MAKDNPKGTAVQFKVHLKPTEVGALVIKRMERPHADKSVELRRYIELGYAAEQAGFILDGTVLRHAGRVWDIQPIFNVKEASVSLPVENVLPATVLPSPADPESVNPLPASTGIDQRSSTKDREGKGENSIGPTSLKANLRGISG